MAEVAITVHNIVVMESTPKIRGADISELGFSRQVSWDSSDSLYSNRSANWSVYTVNISLVPADYRDESPLPQPLTESSNVRRLQREHVDSPPDNILAVDNVLE